MKHIRDKVWHLKYDNFNHEFKQLTQILQKQDSSHIEKDEVQSIFLYENILIVPKILLVFFHRIFLMISLHCINFNQNIVPISL